MNVAIWIVTVALAAVFALAGFSKLTQPKEGLVERMAWAEAFPEWGLKGIGAAELLGAIGLILPAVFDIATWLVPAAAFGLALVMVGAAITHLRRKEYSMIAANAVLFAAAVFVAVERTGPNPF